MWAIFQFLLLTQSQCTRVISAVRFQFSSRPLEEDHPGARSPSSSCSPTWWVGILPHCLWTSVSSWSRHAPREGRLSARAAGRGAARRPLRGGPLVLLHLLGSQRSPAGREHTELSPVSQQMGKHTLTAEMAYLWYQVSELPEWKLQGFSREKQGIWRQTVIISMTSR